MDFTPRPVVVFFIWHTLLFLRASGLNDDLSAYSVASFSIPYECDECDPTWNHFVVHNATGHTYVAGDNILVHLDPSFAEIQRVNTRIECPIVDGIEVDFADCKNLNKLSIIHYRNNKLITCGSENGGKCQVMDPGDISDEIEVDREVVPSGNRTTSYIIASDMLYIAATYDQRRSDVAPISRRGLSDNPQLLLYEDESVEFSSLANQGRDYVIHYAGRYVFEGFIYFVASQRYDLDLGNLGDNRYYSKISRVCQDDSVNFDAFTEITIYCLGNDGTEYNLVQSTHVGPAGSDLSMSLNVTTGDNILYGVFAKSVDEGDGGDTATKKSALCVFNLNEIQNECISAIADCFNVGNSRNELSYVDGADCETFGLNDPELSQYYAILQECEAFNYAKPKGKLNSPLKSTAIVEWQDKLVSSIITTTERHHTIAFIGTSTGKLLKLHIQNTNESRNYETLSLNGRVLRDVELDDDKEYITVLTELEIYKLAVENCSHFSTCEECIGITTADGDPYCGWCTLSRQCTRWHECDMPDASARWLSYNETQCSGISQVQPLESQPFTVPQEITVTIEQLPDLVVGQSYKCVFERDSLSLESEATKFGNDLQCMTPPSDQLPIIPKGTDHIVMLLSILSTETNVKFVDTNHTFYECGTHTRCLDCASSNWNCNWCTYGDICTHDSKTFCPDDDDNSIIAGEKLTIRQQPMRQGPAECAQLDYRPEEVLLAAGVDREINITVKNLPNITLVPADSYSCILCIEGKEEIVAAKRIEDETVQCIKTQFSYQDDIQELIANLSLIWTWNGNLRTIDDEFGFNVTLFKCEVLRPDCSRCVSKNTARPELRCGWCSTSDMCAVVDHPECGPNESWIMPDTGTEKKNCPRPVLSIWPSSGPIEGNTLIEINGTDLGRSFNNIKSVTVAGRECRYTEFKDMYEISERLFCMTTMSEADSTDGMDVFVEVERIDGTNQMNDGGTTFSYRNPDIREFSPEFGPEAGGTMVNITGRYLLTGRNINIQIGNATCSFDWFSEDQEELRCSTSDSYEGNTTPITMIFDGAKRVSNGSYQYRGNPDISNVRPSKAFEAGGRMLTVTGTNLDVVQTPRIVISLGGNDYTQECEVRNNNATEMTCPSPPVEVASRRRRQEDDSDSATVGFIMDGVRDLLTWSTNGNRSFVLTYYENPNYFNFMKNMSFGADELQIEGERLNLASDESDVTVYVGGLICEIVSLGSEVLTCRIPEEVRNNTAENFNVTIIQGNLYFEDIGVIIFLQEPTVEPPIKGIPMEVIIGVAAVAFVLLVLSIILTVVFRAREKRAIKQTKKLLHEMEKLEESMAGTIREAFAQLQLDLRDLTSDLEGTGMPFVTPAQYATKMLFAGINIKPSTADPIDLDERKVRAMEEFSKLLQDKNFLLTFIRVLDEPRSAPVPVIRERTKFACFLTTLMLLEDKLPHLTELEWQPTKQIREHGLFGPSPQTSLIVMLTLLESDIDAAVEDDRAFQLCQRTETVVERLLTNWVSVCLFHHLKDQAAFPLFVLYRAILLQTEKGPVDIVTGKAYYSLSEHYVLTLDNIEYKSMTLKVVVNAVDGESKEINVINLDTISQVKEKILDLIYRNKAYSDRPDTSVVDLEWRHGKAGRLILRDDDQTTIKDDEFRKMNTLEHYKIPDGAKVALVAKQNVPNGAIDPNILRTSIFVQGEEDEDEGADAQTIRVRRPKVSLYQERARARYTVYELDSVPMDDPDRNLKVYHLEREEEEHGDFRKSWAAARNRLSRRVSEAINQHKTNVRKIHYPQLLTTKGATYQFVDQMFDAVLDTDHIPRTVKYMFDFLDFEAQRRNITESEIVHKWKSNCLPLRFWVTIINNPQYIFDIRESRSVTSSLNVVGQAFFDAFNRTEHKNNMVPPASHQSTVTILGKPIHFLSDIIKNHSADLLMSQSNNALSLASLSVETAFNKLLYHRELGGFQERVDNYYETINDLPQVDNTEMAEELNMISQQFSGVFSRMSTLTHLYNFAQINNDKLIEALEEDEICRKSNLAYKLENIAAILEGETV